MSRRMGLKAQGQRDAIITALMDAGVAMTTRELSLVCPPITAHYSCHPSRHEQHHLVGPTRDFPWVMSETCDDGVVIVTRRPLPNEISRILRGLVADGLVWRLEVGNSCAAAWHYIGPEGTDVADLEAMYAADSATRDGGD